MTFRRHFDEVLMREWERGCWLRSRLMLLSLSPGRLLRYVAVEEVSVAGRDW
jgi:hypothetical protein